MDPSSGHVADAASCHSILLSDVAAKVFHSLQSSGCAWAQTTDSFQFMGRETAHASVPHCFGGHHLSCLVMCCIGFRGWIFCRHEDLERSHIYSILHDNPRPHGFQLTMRTVMSMQSHNSRKLENIKILCLETSSQPPSSARQQPISCVMQLAKAGYKRRAGHT